MRGRIITVAAVVVALGAGASAAQELPDLIVDDETLSQSWFIEERYFPPNHCALVEGCVAAPGVRKLLRFATHTANIARTDLYFGDPSGNPLFEYSPCHGHYHFEDYADYRLEDLLGNPVAPGHKQAFCLLDSLQYIFEPWVPGTRAYNCADQGIQRGWSDVYGSQLDCQWIDVTDIPNGAYVLEISINPGQIIAEEDHENNFAAAAVVVTDADGVSHRPDGRLVPGAALRVGRQATLDRLVYDVATCPAAAYHVMYGQATTPGAYVYDGVICDIGTSGDTLVALPEPLPGELLWFTVVGSDGADEGGHGFDAEGRPRPLSGVGFCGVQQTRPRLYCTQ